MTYTKQTWNNNDPSTPVSAERLSYIEEGIETVAATAVDTSATAQSKAGALRISVGEPRFDVRSSAFNGGDWSSPAARRATIQAAVDAWAAVGGTLVFPALAAAVDLSGGSIIWPEHTAYPRKQTSLNIEGNGITLSTTSAHPIFKDNMPADNTAAINRNVKRMFAIRNLHLVGSGSALAGQTLLQIIGSYSTVLERVSVTNAGAHGIDLVFCLNAVLRHCMGERNFGRTYWVRSGLDIDNANAPLWSGAGATNSNGNVVTFEHCRDYCRTGQTAAFAIDGTDQVTLDHPIWEGENPVDAVVYRQGTSTTTKSFSVIESHPENSPTNSHIKLVGTQGGDVLIEGGSFTQGAIMMDASGFSIGKIHWHNQPFLSGKWRCTPTDSTVWCFDMCGGVGTNPKAAGFWDTGAPAYFAPILRTANSTLEPGIGNEGVLDCSVYSTAASRPFKFLSPDVSPKIQAFFPNGVSIGLWNAQAVAATLANNSVFMWFEPATGALVFTVKDNAGLTRNLKIGAQLPLLGANAAVAEGGSYASSTVGGLHVNTAGGAGTVLSVKESGTGTTGWKLVLTRSGITLDDAANFAVGTTTGTKIGTSTTQKLGFFNATPVVQPAANPDTSGALLGALETEVNELKAALRSLGLIAT